MRVSSVSEGDRTDRERGRLRELCCRAPTSRACSRAESRREERPGRQTAERVCVISVKRSESHKHVLEEENLPYTTLYTRDAYAAFIHKRNDAWATYGKLTRDAWQQEA